ncbi:hypothetical protein LCGC14_0556630 [marine sediment metagenome]|uniref:Uncharacterized protein n=1 Tax=marine sediment metagenome TaxID=412755 RepID=A0A0F9RN80_9ZZZZ
MKQNIKEKVLKEIWITKDLLKEAKEIVPREIIRTRKAIDLTLAEAKKNPEVLGLVDEKRFFPKKKGYIMFDEDQYFKRKKEIEEEKLAEVGKVIDEWIMRHRELGLIGFIKDGENEGSYGEDHRLVELKQKLGIK